jgi:hypothetical protein
MLGRDSYQLQTEIRKWCGEQFGEYNYTIKDCERWSVTEMFGYQTYTFRDAKDAMWFKIKWVV